MSKTVIRFGLSEKEIDRAIKEVEDYKKEFSRKIQLFQKEVADRIEALANSGFAGAIVDDLLPNSGGARIAQVSTSVDERGNILVVIAKGEDAVWVEFGAGVYHNGSAGSSPNPLSAKNNLGFTIGGFGEKGVKNVWGFKENGELRLTHGTPAVMPMYNAMKTVSSEIEKIVKEVWK